MAGTSPRVEKLRASGVQAGSAANDMAVALSGKTYTLPTVCCEGPPQQDEMAKKPEFLTPGHTKTLTLTDKNSDRLAEDLMQNTFQALPVKPKHAFPQEKPDIECEYLGENEEGDVVVEMTVTHTITATFDSETCKKAACHTGSIERPSYKPAELPAPGPGDRTVRIGEVQESGTSGGLRHDSYQSAQDMDRTLSDIVLEPEEGTGAPPCLKPYPCKDLGCEWMVDAGKVHINRRLAVGGFAEVFLGQYEGTRVAVKRLFSQSNQDEFRREVRLLAGLRHPNLLLFMGYTLYPSLSIITEYMQRGSLYNILDKHRGSGPLELKLQRSVALSVARGMAYLHSRSPPILHLDLKSANILVDNAWRVKLGDFGLSRIRTNSFMSSAASAGGTPQWMAPEVLRSERYDEAADVYSFGVVLWEVLTGEGPWADMHAMQVVGAVGFQGRTLPRPTSPQADEFLVDLCMACMHPVASRRPLFPTIVDAMDLQFNHPSSSSAPSFSWDSASDPIERSLPPSTRTNVSGASSGPIHRVSEVESSSDDDERVIIRALSEESALKAQQANTSSAPEDSKLYGLFREPSAKSPFDSAASLAGVRDAVAKHGLDIDSPFLQEMVSPAPQKQQQQRREPSIDSPFLQKMAATAPQQQQREPSIASPFLQEMAAPAPQQQQREPSIASPFLQEMAAPARQQQQREPSIASPFLQETAAPAPQQQQREPSIASPFLQEMAAPAPQSRRRAPSIDSPFLQNSSAPDSQEQQRETSIASPFLQEAAPLLPQQQPRDASTASPFLQEEELPSARQQRRGPATASLPPHETSEPVSARSSEAGLAVLQTKLEGVQLREPREEGATSLAAGTPSMSGNEERPPSVPVTSLVRADRSDNASSELQSEMSMSDELDIGRWVSVKFEHGDMIVGSDDSKPRTPGRCSNRSSDSGSKHELDEASMTPAKKGSSCRVKHTLAWLAGLNKNFKTTRSTIQGKTKIEK